MIPVFGIMTVINDINMARVLFIIKRNPKAKEDTILKIFNNDSNSRAGHATPDILTKRTLQRIKQRWCKIPQSEQRDFLVLYYNHPIKLMLYRNMHPKHDISYEDFARDLNLVEVQPSLVNAILNRDSEK